MWGRCGKDACLAVVVMDDLTYDMDISMDVPLYTTTKTFEAQVSKYLTTSSTPPKNLLSLGYALRY